MISGVCHDVVGLAGLCVLIDRWREVFYYKTKCYAKRVYFRKRCEGSSNRELD
jgi:hypothetical protein